MSAVAEIENIELYPVKKTLSPVNAVLIVEGVADAAEEEVIEAWGYLIRTGIVWQLQGSYGRTARQLIESGVIDCGG